MRPGVAAGPLFVPIGRPTVRHLEAHILNLASYSLIGNSFGIAARIYAEQINWRGTREGGLTRIKNGARMPQEIFGDQSRELHKIAHPAPLVFVFPTSALAAMKSMIMPATSLPVAASMPSMPGEELTSMITGP